MLYFTFLSISVLECEKDNSYSSHQFNEQYLVGVALKQYLRFKLKSHK